MKLSEGEKLILLMLCEIQEHLKVKGETDTNLIKGAIFSGNVWGLEWAMPGVFHGSETPYEVVRETANHLTMWERLEQSFNGLKAEDKERLGKELKFDGWDGNDQTEAQYISAAQFLVDHLGRFQAFKGRSFNAHMETLEANRRMYAVFEPILRQVTNKDFSADQIAEVLDAYKHPGAKG